MLLCIFILITKGSGRKETYRTMMINVEYRNIILNRLISEKNHIPKVNSFSISSLKLKLTQEKEHRTQNLLTLEITDQ